jgi:DNA helicase MCM8
VYGDNAQTTKKIKAFESYFTKLAENIDVDLIETVGAVAVDYDELLKDSGLQTDLPDLSTMVREQPELTLNCASLALHTVIERLPADKSQDLDSSDSEAEVDTTLDVSRLFVRLYNYRPVMPLKQLKASQFGKCVSVSGTVVRVSNAKPLVTKLAFKCVVCATIQVLALQDGKYAIPTRCQGEDCSCRTFIPLRGSQLTETIDWQTIRIQEIVNDETREAGRIPRTVECELIGDLVDSCIPGDNITVTAVVKAAGSEEARGRNKDKCMFILYLSAISVCNGKGSRDCGGSQMEFSMRELYGINEIQGDSNVFKLIVGSLCPTIYGQEIVKAGLILGLFGGSSKHADDTNGIPVRGDPHILIVGDPGLGKSQMLQAAANVAPRGVYVCGNTSTASGLTVTLSRDGSNGGDYALEAGALVLGDQGCCCIDEFDKMSTQHQAILEAMEQQTISLAKAGIVCSLPARTSVLAAANPVGGHYNKGKTVSENLKMGSALLSRFDLVFILLDKPDGERDQMLSEHVMSLHSKKTGVATARRMPNGTVEASQSSQSVSRIFSDTTLAEKLKQSLHEDCDPIPHVLLRKYISYARKYVHPKLSPEAAKVLQEFYLELRKQRQSGNTTPITTRQLESLIRLTEARARVEMRELAIEQDAQDVIEIMKFSMYDTFSDDFGQVHFQRSQNGSGMSSRSQAKRFIAELNRISETTFNSLFSVPQMKDIAKKIGIQVSNVIDFIGSLNNQGYLLKKGPKTYQLQTSNCI